LLIASPLPRISGGQAIAVRDFCPWLAYVVIYRLRGDSVQIVAIFHTARTRRF